MDIFNKLSKQAIDTYLSEYLAKIGVPEFIQLDRTRKLSERGDSMNCGMLVKKPVFTLWWNMTEICGITILKLHGTRQNLNR